jgi:hypothetical protein
MMLSGGAWLPGLSDPRSIRLLPGFTEKSDPCHRRNGQFSIHFAQWIAVVLRFASIVGCKNENGHDDHLLCMFLYRNMYFIVSVFWGEIYHAWASIDQGISKLNMKNEKFLIVFCPTVRVMAVW